MYKLLSCTESTVSSNKMFLQYKPFAVSLLYFFAKIVSVLFVLVADWFCLTQKCNMVINVFHHFSHYSLERKQQHNGEYKLFLFTILENAWKMSVLLESYVF